MNNYIHSLHHHYPKQPITKPNSNGTADFKQVLNDVSNLKVSKHAQMRLEQRKINISSAKWSQISEKMNEAKIKGVTDALVVMEDVALVVSTKNNTVVTAIHNEEAVNKIFTNINGTILL